MAEWNAGEYNQHSSLQAALVEAQLGRLTLEGDERIPGRRDTSTGGRAGRRVQHRLQRVTQPGLILGEVRIRLERRQQRVVGLDPRRLEHGVILERLGENLPAYRVNRAVLAGVDHERVAVGNVRPLAAGSF